MPQPIIHRRREEHKRGTADAAKEGITRQDRGRVIWIGVWEIIQDGNLRFNMSTDSREG